ncbi:LOW QUALITY PROTEIN: basal body-orientation factor 1-like [Amphiura filiformis]|uniref:LOW QUALITY PROTEIN: basal body-orientation factor 1-like n=1 Tax=Amphiura filiformis TaxID=82378 RepID=UPI003B210DBD
MPKKTKKGSREVREGTGKGKGKGKGKKGKKKEKFTDQAQSVANTKIWETRLNATERSRQEFRENAKILSLENEALQRQMVQTEKDTIDVITYLKKEDHSKEDLISRLQKQLKDTRRESRKEKQQIIEDFTSRLNTLQESLKEKTGEVKMMQSELKLVKEFRRKRGQMQKELDEIKEEMFLTNKEHKQQLQRMEHKFFEEKIRLQQEASQKIAELAERAHTEAIGKLDETTRSVYKENVRVNEVLSYHMKESEELKNTKDKLAEHVKRLEGERELHEQLVQDKVVETKKQKQQIKDLKEKVQNLETSLSHVVQEFEREGQIVAHKAEIVSESSKVEIAKLMRTVEMQTKEMNKIKKLAKSILDQRTEMEQFFLDSLGVVKKEILANRAKYLKDAATAYHKRMMEAHDGKTDFPKIRNFKQSDTSTNSVYADLKAAEAWSGLGGKIDIGELTWEQRERVLRLLFAKMNGSKVKPKAPHNLGPSHSITHQAASIAAVRTPANSLAIEAPPDASRPDTTFLTQADLSQDLPTNPVLPAVGSRQETAVVL